MACAITCFTSRAYKPLVSAAPIREVDRLVLLTTFDHAAEHEQKDHLDEEVEGDDQVDDGRHAAARLADVGDRQSEEQEGAQVGDQRDRINRVLPQLAVGQQAAQQPRPPSLQWNRLGRQLHSHLWPRSSTVCPGAHAPGNGVAPGARMVPSGATLDASVTCVSPEFTSPYKPP